MTEQEPSLVPMPDGYVEWLASLKSQIHSAQLRAALAVNTELLSLYWRIGKEILDRQEHDGWGSKVTARLSHDLMMAFPDMRGFSQRNLMYMRKFAQAWPGGAIVQQPVAQLPWGHNLVLLTKLATAEERLAYADAAIRHGWSRNVLTLQIERRVIGRRLSTRSVFASLATKQPSRHRPDRTGAPARDSIAGDCLQVGCGAATGLRRIRRRGRRARWLSLRASSSETRPARRGIDCQ